MGSENLETFRLSERCNIKSSKRIFAREYVDTGVPFWRSKDVIDKSLGVFEEFDLYISRERFEEIASKFGFPKEGDLLISSVGNRSGQPFVVQDEGDFYFKDGNILWASEFSNLDSEFLAYWLKSPKGQATLSSIMIGSAQKAITIDALRGLEVSFPKYETQICVVSILKRFDQKIALNNQINQTLEQMAQTLFKSWFVDFDPVIDNALDAGSECPEAFETRVARRKAVRESADFKPLPDDVRQLFPSEFEESELGWVPKGWGATNLSDFIKFANGKAKKSIEGAVYPLYGANGIIGQSNEAKFNDAIVIGRVGAYCGSIEYCNTSFWASDNTIVAEPKGQITHLPFVLYLLKHLNLNKFAGGAAQPLLNQKVLSSIQVPLSSLDVLESFGSIVSANLEKMFSLNQESTSLEKLRDTLLPKLISGELRLDSPEVEQTKALVE